MTSHVPVQQPGESSRAYYRRVRTIRDALRAFLPELRTPALQAGREAGLSARSIAKRMGVTTAWLYTPHEEAAVYDAELIPVQLDDEDVLAYYRRLAELRDALAQRLPGLLVTAAREAERETPRPTRTQVAADLGVTAAYLYRQLQAARSAEAERS